MKKRNPIAVLLLPFVTFGIYSLYWFVKTKGEMNERGAKIPTAWLIIVPIVNLWWTWKYCEGVELVTGGKLNGLLCLVLLLVVGPIGAAIIQDSFNNNVVAAPAGPIIEGAPAPVAAAEPTPSAETPAPTEPETATPETPAAPAPTEETPAEPTAEPTPQPEENNQQTPPPATPTV